MEGQSEEPFLQCSLLAGRLRSWQYLDSVAAVAAYKELLVHPCSIPCHCLAAQESSCKKSAELVPSSPFAARLCR